MSRQVRTRTTAGIVVLALLGSALFAAGTVFFGADHAIGGPAEVYLLSAPGAVNPPGVTNVQAVHRVATLQELQSVMVPPALVIVDRSAVNGMPLASLRSLVSQGSAVVGINVSLEELSALTGFDEELSAMNPQFSKAASTTTLAPSFTGDFFSLVWRTPPGAQTAYWGRVQNDLTPSLFSAIVSDYRLRVRGLVMENGAVVPLEKYGSGGVQSQPQ